MPDLSCLCNGCTSHHNRAASRLRTNLGGDVPPLTLMRLLRIPGAFDHEEFLFEPKFDGFRALAFIDRGRLHPRLAERQHLAT